MVFAIRFVGGTLYTDWLRALKVKQKCMRALIQEVHTLHLAAGGTLAAKRRDWRNAASRREHVFTPSQHGFHAATGACVMIGFVAQPCCFLLVRAR